MPPWNRFLKLGPRLLLPTTHALWADPAPRMGMQGDALPVVSLGAGLSVSEVRASVTGSATCVMLNPGGIFKW